MRITQRGHRAVHRGPQRSATATVVACLVLAVVVAVALALSTGAVARRTGAEEAGRTFQQVTVVVVGSVVAPLLTPELVGRDASAAAELGRTVDRLESGSTILAVTVRDGQGAVVWTDDGSATTAPLRPYQRTALQDGTLQLDPASADGSPEEPLLASTGVHGTAGTLLLVDVTGQREVSTAASRSAWNSFAPIALGALLLLQLLQLPLVARLAGRVRRLQRAETALRRAARAATDVERRRIAREVHNDVLPGLHGLAYELDAARLTGSDPHRAEVLLERAAAGLRSGIRRLRALLLDLSQDRMPEAGLATALAEMAARMETAGVEVSVDAPDIDQVPRPVAEVLYRCAQEALRNVAAHSGAERVELAVVVDDTDVSMTVDDDGRGFEAPRLDESRADGHLGLRTLGDLVADSGGSLTASSSPGQGTRIVVRVPLDDAGVDMRVQT